MNHTFDVAIAAEHGVHAAVLFENIRYWIAKNKANGAHFHDGRYWTYSSYAAFAELFPYLTERQIKYALQKLRDAGMLITGNYNQQPFDRTMWYALGDGIFTENGDSIDQNCTPQSPILSGLNGQNCPTNTYYNPDINTDINNRECVGHLPHRPAAKAAGRTHTRKYGQYENVRLSPEELLQLKQRFPRDWHERIDRLSEYIASKGDKYKSHYATILSWARQDAAKGTVGDTQAQAPRLPKVNPAQQYEQRKYDDEALKARVAVAFSALEEDGG